MAEQRFELLPSATGFAEKVEPDAAARARASFASAVKRIADSAPVGDGIASTSELELLEAATAVTARRR